MTGSPSGEPRTTLSWLPGTAGRAGLADPMTGGASPTAPDNAPSVMEITSQPLPIPKPMEPAKSSTQKVNERHPDAPAGGFVSVPSPEELRYANRVVGSMSNDQLLAKLNASETHQFLAATIARELNRRGINQNDVERLQRQQRPSSEPGNQTSSGGQELRSIEMLRSQTRHANPVVRRRALGLLATSNDPRLPQLALERALYDDDPEVEEIA